METLRIRSHSIQIVEGDVPSVMHDGGVGNSLSHFRDKPTGGVLVQMGTPRI